MLLNQDVGEKKNPTSKHYDLYSVNYSNYKQAITFLCVKKKRGNTLIRPVTVMVIFKCSGTYPSLNLRAR